jgi:hypothetical protein
VLRGQEVVRDQGVDLGDRDELVDQHVFVGAAMSNGVRPSTTVGAAHGADDTRDKVGQGELRGAALFTAALVAAACNADPPDTKRWRA